MTSRILVVIPLSLFCFARAPAAATLDPSLLQQWNRHAKLPCRAPFLATFKKDGKEITFLAVNHIEGPVKASESELSLVAQQVKQIGPSGILIEMDTGGGNLSREYLRSIYSNCIDKDGKFFCGEASYAALTAGRENANAAVLGGEPSRSALQTELGKKLSREDHLAFESLKTVISMKREGLPATEWSKVFNQRLKNNLSSFSTDEWSYEKFSTWLRKNMGVSIDRVEDQWMEPRSDAGASRMQKIAAQVGQIREPMILSAAERLINGSTKTMIVYGSSHYFKQLPAYEKAFGRPEVECLEPVPRAKTAPDPVETESEPSSSAR